MLVIGASSDLGSRIVAALQTRDVPVRPFSRTPVPEGVVGDLSDPASLDRALRGVTRVFLQSSPVQRQVALETNAIEAAEGAGVERIVKLSNIPVAGLETGLHGNHRAIERRLSSSPVASVFVQPSFFSTVLQKQADQLAQGRMIMPAGRGKIAWIDPVDIASVAVEALVRDDLSGPLHITGPEALDAADVADRLGVQLVEPPIEQWHTAVVAGGLDPWLAESTVHLYRAIARGALAEVTDTVERVTGRAPRRVFVPDAAG